MQACPPQHSMSRASRSPVGRVTPADEPYIRGVHLFVSVLLRHNWSWNAIWACASLSPRTKGSEQMDRQINDLDDLFQCYPLTLEETQVELWRNRLRERKLENWWYIHVCWSHSINSLWFCVCSRFVDLQTERREERRDGCAWVSVSAGVLVSRQRYMLKTVSFFHRKRCGLNHRKPWRRLWCLDNKKLHKNKSASQGSELSCRWLYLWL